VVVLICVQDPPLEGHAPAQSTASVRTLSVALMGSLTGVVVQRLLVPVFVLLS
jgi:hypothetical protein